MTPEKTVENHIRKNVEQAGGWIVKFFASPNTNKGVPDLLSVINGRFCAFEVKRPTGGKPTPVQLWHLQQIANAGGIGLVTNDPNVVQLVSQASGNNQQKVAGNTGCLIDYASFDQQPDVKAATHLWRQTKGRHSLQILPNPEAERTIKQNDSN